MRSFIEDEHYQRILNTYGGDTIDVGRVYVLIEMVKNGDYPDTDFNATEVMIWNAVVDAVDYYEKELREHLSE